MIDLIIPYYNNLKGLKRTLESIDQNIFYVTIIDDNSSHTPWCPNANQVFRYNKNQGPGHARQHGINKTNNPYIMFIDAGDVFISFKVQANIKAIIDMNPDINLFSFPYFYDGEVTKETDNRMHGKVYKRSFLEKYNITFPLETSYYDEDIGFNRACRRCTEAENQPIYYGILPVLEWIKEPNSLSQKNNQIKLFKDQTHALSLASIHTIDILKNNHIDITTEINQIGIALYYWFIRTAAERSEYIQEAWDGARIFYNTFKNEIKPNQLSMGNAHLKRCLLYKDKINFPVNILRFAHDIQNFQIIPNRYRGEKNEEILCNSKS